MTSFRIEEEKRLNLAALEPPRKHPHQPLCKTNRKALASARLEAGIPNFTKAVNKPKRVSVLKCKIFKVSGS